MQKIGILGEKIVGKWLESQNYGLLQQNWRCRWGEIDIIAQSKVSKTIAFVEVKTRSKNNWDEGGLLAIDAVKQEKIIKTASLFLARYPQFAEFPCRFDVALVSYKSLSLRRKDAEKRETKRDDEEVARPSLGKPVAIEQYHLTIESYLQSAFELT